METVAIQRINEFKTDRVYVVWHCALNKAKKCGCNPKLKTRREEWLDGMKNKMNSHLS